MIKRVIALCTMMVMLALPLGVMAQEMTPSVTVEDQEIVDGNVTIASVVSSGPGWLVIHIDNNGSPGPVIGFSPVVDGENSDVVVAIDPTQATEVLYAMLHTDAGTVGTYEFPGEDGPVMVDGQVVTPSFNVISAAMEEGEMTGEDGAMEAEEPVAEGEEAMAEGEEAMAEGEEAMAEGEEAMAEGEEAMAEGEEAMAEGDAAMAEGDAAMAMVACETDYVVQADDWLSKIADKFYADVLAFPAIVEATNAHAGSAAMGETAMAEGDAAMAEAESDEAAMAEEATMAEGKLMVQSADGQMMDVSMGDEGQMMVQGADGQMTDITMDSEGNLMMADGTMMEGSSLVLEGADGQMMDVTMDAEGKLMVQGADGQMMEVATGEQAMEDAAMAEGDAAMAEGEAAMAESETMAGYARIDNPDVIEIGWTLCIPSLADAQQLLSGGTGAMEEAPSQ